MKYIFFIIVFPQQFSSNNLSLTLVQMIDDSIECDLNNSHLVIILISFTLWHCMLIRMTHTLSISLIRISSCFHATYRDCKNLSVHVFYTEIKCGTIIVLIVTLLSH